MYGQDNYTMEQLSAALVQFRMTFGDRNSDFVSTLAGFGQQTPELVQALNAHTAALEADHRSRAAHTEALQAHASALRSHEEALYESVRQARMS